MNIKTIMENVNNVFQQNLQNFCKNNDTGQLSEDLSENFIGMLKDTVSQIGLDAIKQFLESYEVDDSEIIENGNTCRFKYISSKQFLTPFGSLDISRRVFQHDRGGQAVIPLDKKWGMEHEYATMDVREAVLYSVNSPFIPRPIPNLNQCFG